MSLALEEKYDQVRQLIAMGKERGYLLYDEVNDILPAEVHSSEEIDDLLSTFERNGIDVYEDLSSAKAALAAADASDTPEVVVKEEAASKTSNSISRPAPWKKRTTPFACICARWARFRCSRAKAKSKSPSASSAANSAFSKPSRALR